MQAKLPDPEVWSADGPVPWLGVGSFIHHQSNTYPPGALELVGSFFHVQKVCSVDPKSQKSSTDGSKSTISGINLHIRISSDTNK